MRAADRDVSIRLRRFLRATCALLLVGFLCASAAGAEPPHEWPCCGNDPGGTRHSPLTQIDRTNVKHLKPVWTYRRASWSV
jgi:hypothetical protein